MTLRPHTFFSRLFCLALLATALPAAEGSLSYFLQIPGVQGESTDPPFENWIVAIGVGAEITNTGGVPSLPAVYVAKKVDRATPLLKKMAAAGDPITEARINVRDHNGVMVYSILLKDVFLKEVRHSSGENEVFEELLLEFKRIEWTYTISDIGHWDKAANAGGSGPLPGSTPNPDTDFDGIPNDYELENDLNPNLNDADGDLDGDGVSNRGEYIADTRANDPLSVFRVTAISKDNGMMLVEWNSVAGKTYHLLGATSPAGPFSSAVQNIPADGDDDKTSVMVSAAAGPFFRVLTQ